MIMRKQLDYEAIGKRIKACRKQRGMTQAGMADAIGLSTSFFGHIERGTRIPSLETLWRIAGELETSIELLLTGEPGGNLRISEHHQHRMLDDMMRVLQKHAQEWRLQLM